MTKPLVPTSQSLQESLLNQLGYTNVATGNILAFLTLENLVLMDPELIIYVTSDVTKIGWKKDFQDKGANTVWKMCPSNQEQKPFISYDELMDYCPAVLIHLKIMTYQEMGEFNWEANCVSRAFKLWL